MFAGIADRRRGVPAAFDGGGESGAAHGRRFRWWRLADGRTADRPDGLPDRQARRTVAGIRRESLPAFQTALNGLASARHGGTGANPSGAGGRNGGRLRRVSGDGGGRYYPATVETSGAGRYARNKHSLFHARRGQTGAERREFRRAEAGAVFLMHLLAKWCKEWCKGKNIFSMFTGFSRTAAINIGVPMVCFRLMGERRLCVSVRTCGRHRRRT